VLLGTAAGRDLGEEAFRGLLTEVLTALGWRARTGGPVPYWAAAQAAGQTTRLLEAVGALSRPCGPNASRPSAAAGAAFARAVLREHP